MPGSQTIPVRDFPYGALEMKALPKSWLRFVPLIGGARMFRHGARITFTVRTRCIEAATVEEKKAEVPHAVEIHTEFEEGDIQRKDTVRLPPPGSYNERHTYELPPLFLERSGDVTIKIRHEPTATFDTLYAFRVIDPTFTALTWGVAIVAAILSAVITAILTVQFTSGGSNGQP